MERRRRLLLMLAEEKVIHLGCAFAQEFMRRFRIDDGHRIDIRTLRRDSQALVEEKLAVLHRIEVPRAPGRVETILFLLQPSVNAHGVEVRAKIEKLQAPRKRKHEQD